MTASPTSSTPHVTHHVDGTQQDVVYQHGVPVIDLQNHDETTLVQQIALACATFGFFQVTNHGISQALLDSFRTQMSLCFDLPPETKHQYKRHECNARGYFDDELTKQRRDWKEAWDVGVPGSRDWNLNDMDERNACLDGFNQFPSRQELPEFRSVVIEYFQACTKLSHELAVLMAKGLSTDHNKKNELSPTAHEFVESLRNHHSSYLRMNYYPPYPNNTTTATTRSDENHKEPPPLGISPHKDAGFLTVLAQDEDCHSLQVARHYREEVDKDLSQLDWVTVKPVKGALTINTGDMAMIWSNGKYRAPLHRVRTNPTHRRYSAPFFYNPGYHTMVTSPLVVSTSTDTSKDESIETRRYHDCLWGYFRAVRFAGDLTDLGVEIQASDYLVSQKSHHLQKQNVFARQAHVQEPFSVDKYRPLLVEDE